jgi:two-component system, sensor histidine kinase PdtaS
LDANSAISYASPNAKSAFSRMGWRGDLEGKNLGEIAEQVVTASLNAHEEGIRSRLNGKILQRVEIDNQGATIDLLVLPLVAG